MSITDPHKFGSRGPLLLREIEIQELQLQSRSYACPRCKTPRRLQLKFHLVMVARYGAGTVDFSCSKRSVKEGDRFSICSVVLKTTHSMQTR